MLTAIYLQRRRILFGMFFFFLAGLVDFGAFGGWANPIGVIALSILFALITGGLAALLIPIFPAYRQVFEIVSTTFLAMRIVESMGWGGRYYYVLEGAWGLIAVCLGYTLLFHFIYGAWWAKTPFRLSWRGVSRFTTSADPDTAWARLVPDAERPGDYYSGTLHEFRPAEGAEYTHLFRTRMGGAQFTELRATVTRNDPGAGFAFDFDADVSDQNRGMNSGFWRIELSPQGDGTAVHVIDEITATTPAVALSLWFDDLGGQVAVSMKRVLEGRRDPTILGWNRKQIQAAA